MSFAGGDASCSAGANPMTQMLKQFGQDRSLQQVTKSGWGYFQVQMTNV